MGAGTPLSLAAARPDLPLASTSRLFSCQVAATREFA